MVRKKKAATWLLMFLIAGIVALLAGCEALVTPLGSIELTVSQSSGTAKTLLPSLDMNPATYTITGVGPSGVTITPLTINASDPSTTITGLRVGSWTFTAEAKNSGGTIIGSGNKTITVVPGNTLGGAITVVPLSGNGDLTISLQWTGSIANPAVVAALSPTGGGNDIDPDTNSISGNLAQLIWNDVPVGYYTLSVQLKDGTTDKAGKTEVVRILKDQTTNGTYNFTF